MAFLFRKFQEAVKLIAKNPRFARDPRHLQYEADINRLFLCTSYNRLGNDADEGDADEIIDMASKASVKDQENQVQENVHLQFKNLCKIMDEILLPDSTNNTSVPGSSPISQNPPRRSGLSFAVGIAGPSSNEHFVPPTRPLTRMELSQRLMERIGYTPDIKPSQILHEDAGQGLFLNGKADVGSIIAFYPGMVYSPAHYPYIPGYPKVDASNSYLITRYDGTVINGQPWGCGGETREMWDGLSSYSQHNSHSPGETYRGSDRIWRMLSKPLKPPTAATIREVLERRNPLAFGHFANHPPKGTSPNVIVCPYDFPLTEKDMRVYVPNLVFGHEQNVRMKKYGSFWFRVGSSRDNGADSPVLKTLVLVATRTLCDEELFLNYRLSNQKRRPSWYTPVNEEEDRRRWS